MFQEVWIAQHLLHAGNIREDTAFRIWNTQLFVFLSNADAGYVFLFWTLSLQNTSSTWNQLPWGKMPSFST